jgi:neprosin-like protein
MRAMLPRAAAILGVSLALALAFAAPGSTAQAGSTTAPAAAVPGPPDAPSTTAGVDFYYAAGAISGDIDDPYAKGVTATFTVEKPRQVPGGARSDHSLAELAVENPAMTYSYVEAGWIVRNGAPPKLFIFWWDEGTPKCYNQGCGYVQKGPGIQPGTELDRGATIALTWEHRHSKWWLEVDGKKSGYYPDNQWTNPFAETGFAQVFGEVAVDQGYPVCDDMGNGKDSSRARAASITSVAFLDKPPVPVVYDTDDPAHGYTVSITGTDSLRYGGPGLC